MIAVARRTRAGIVAAAAGLAACLPAAARPPEPAAAALCVAEGLAAAAAEGVPADLLLAIGRVESGRMVGRIRAPWPWTLNVAGRGYFFATRAAAEAKLAGLIAAGTDSIDVGCFQVNLRHHGEAFVSAAAMLDPRANARYAARFLRRLASESGTWEAASGLYHSRTPSRAGPYAARVARERGLLVPAALPAADAPGVRPAAEPMRARTRRLFRLIAARNGV